MECIGHLFGVADASHPVSHLQVLLGGCNNAILSNGWKDDIIQHFDLTDVRTYKTWTFEEVRDGVKEYTDANGTYPPQKWLVDRGLYTESRKYKQRLCEDLCVKYKTKVKNPITKEELIEKCRSISVDGMMPVRGEIVKAYGENEFERIHGWKISNNLTGYELALMCELNPTSQMIAFHNKQLVKRNQKTIQIRINKDMIEPELLEYKLSNDELLNILRQAIEEHTNEQQE